MYWLFQCKRESKEILDIFSDDVEHNKINRLWEMLTYQIKQHNHALNFNTNYLTILYSHSKNFNSIFNVVPDTSGS